MLLLFLCFGIAPASAQPLSGQRLADSLTKAYALATQDTVKIRLRYETGRALKIARIAYWDSLLTDVREQGMTYYEYQVLYEIAYLYFYAYGDTRKGSDYIDQVIRIAEQNGNRKELARAMLKLVSRQFYLSDTRAGINLCYKGLKIAEETGDEFSRARFYSSLALIYWSQHELRKALAMQFRALSIFKKYDNHYEIAGCYLDIGTLYGELGNQGKRVAYYLASEKYAEEFRRTPAGSEINISIATAYMFRKQYKKSAAYLETALKDVKFINCKACEASVLRAMAALYQRTGQLQEAESAALRSIALSKETGFNLGIPLQLKTLSEGYEKQGRFDKALESYKKYIVIRDSASNEESRRLVQAKEFSYNLEKKDNENKLLMQENEIQSLGLKQNRYLIAGLGSLTLFILVSGVLFFRQNKLRSQQQRMKLEQKLLRTQMNPHFIFNSMQAIQNFILKQETREAVKYLSAFAFVTRSVLESSRMDHITLDKEMVLLDHYLQLQKLRFGERFTYSIGFSNPETDPEAVNIPPMMAQPFIENAVEHGMQDIEGGGHIDIMYTLRREQLQIMITDNGQGMQRHGTGKKHRSMAMSITKERIDLMNRKSSHAASLTVTDAFPAHPERKGVKVEIIVPLN